MIFLSISSFGGITGSFFNVKDFGAVGDGKNLDSKAINAAIESAVKAGGGTVLSACRKLPLWLHPFEKQHYPVY